MRNCDTIAYLLLIRVADSGRVYPRLRMAKPRKPPPKSSKAADKKTSAPPTKKTGAKPASKPAPKPAKPVPGPALIKPKDKKVKPSRTLEPVGGDGDTLHGKPIEVPSELDRMRQWPGRLAPGVRAVVGWDVSSVADALRSHALGNLRSSGILLDDLKVNPIIGHCISVRQEAFRTLPRVVMPGKGENAKRFADFIKEVLPDILPDGTIDDWWLHHEFMGESVSAMDWEERTDGKDRWWLPYIKPWHPSQLYHYYRPDVGERTPDGQILAAHTRDRGPVIVEAGFGRWVHISRGTLQPWLNGLIRALAEPYLGDTYTLRDNMALQQRFGQGILKLIHPVEWNDQQAAEGVATVQTAGGGGVIPCPTTKDGNRKVDIELVNANATGASLFDLTERRLLRRFLIALLGQDMTTVGQTGGFAQAAIHNQVLWHKRERDAATFGDARLMHEMGDDGKPKRRWVPYNGPIRQQITRWIAWFNEGNFEAAPYVYFDAQEPEDRLAKAQAEATVAASKAAAMKSIVDALPGLQGIVPQTQADVEFMFEQLGIQLHAPVELTNPKK